MLKLAFLAHSFPFHALPARGVKCRVHYFDAQTAVIRFVESRGAAPPAALADAPAGRPSSLPLPPCPALGEGPASGARAGAGPPRLPPPLPAPASASTSGAGDVGLGHGGGQGAPGGAGPLPLCINLEEDEAVADEDLGLHTLPARAAQGRGAPAWPAQAAPVRPIHLATRRITNPWSRDSRTSPYTVELRFKTMNRLGSSPQIFRCLPCELGIQAEAPAQPQPLQWQPPTAPAQMQPQAQARPPTNNTSKIWAR